MESKGIKSHVITPAIYVTKLAELVGNAETARLVGYAPSAISKAVRMGSCKLVLELAAQFKYEELAGNNEKEEPTDIWFVKPGNHTDMLETLFKSLNIRFIRFKE